MGDIEFHLTLVRHGETESNLTHLVCGQADDPLTPNGQEQARLVGASLAQRHFDIVFASPLERTMQTARAIVDQNKSLGVAGSGIQVDNLLLERSFGKFEKVRIIDHVMAGIRAGYKTADEFWNDYAPESVETMEQVMDRSKQFFDKLRGDILKGGKNSLSILLVGHGMWIQQILMYLASTGKIGTGHLPSAQQLRILACPNTGVTELKVCCDSKDGGLTKGDCLQLYRAEHIGKGPSDLTVMLDLLKRKSGLQLN